MSATPDSPSTPTYVFIKVFNKWLKPFWSPGQLAGVHKTREESTCLLQHKEDLP
jgi:hypothetical protein